MKAWFLACFLASLHGWVLAQNGNEPITMDDFLTGRYGQRGYGGNWISDEELQLRDGNGDIVVYNIKDMSSNVIIPGTFLSDVKADSYVISPDRQFALISYDTHAQFRHSTTARYLVVFLENLIYSDVGYGALISTANWGPVGHSLLFVLDNDIYYTPDVTEQNATRITDSGVPGVIYNGVPDWVYEEEVLGTGTAYWFSPKGETLIYLEFNDTLVPEMTYFRYGAPGTLEDQYPQEVTIRYPKAGAVNPDYKAYSVDLLDPAYPRTLIESRKPGVHYGFIWAREDRYAELIMNRVQNESELAIRTVNGLTRQIFYENPRGWIPSSFFQFDSTGNYLLSIESEPVDDDGFFSHIVLSEVDGQSNLRFLTQGKITALSVLGWDETNNLIYFTGTEEGKPYATQVYVVNTDGDDQRCLTCELLSPEGNPCSSASAKFSTNFTYVILTCSAPDPIFVHLYRNDITLVDPTILENNAALREALKSKSLPRKLDTTIPVPGGLNAQVRLLLPRDFNESLKYPLLINVYGGPDSNQVTDGFSVGWAEYLISSLGVIYGYIDGRGSGRMGDDMLFAGYRALGTVEIQDQINVTRQLQLQYPWIDSNRSAIWGWSYGGFATGKTLELDTESVFKCGISVAPVTSWLYYDSVYTERYMGLPTDEDNLQGYKDGDLVSHVDNLKTKMYYLIHGNADDNVHYQQSMLLSRALELDDVMFQQQSYPDENHSLGGVSRHLYHSMDAFWKKCFQL